LDEAELFRRHATCLVNLMNADGVHRRDELEFFAEFIKRAELDADVTWTDEELPIRERLRGARCMIHWALGERDTAVHLFEAWIAEAPERAAPLVGLGELLSFTGSPLNDLERAVALLERAAKSEGTEGLDVEVHLDNAVHDMNLVRAKPDIARRWNALPGSQ
jgi:hypothetical protein